MKKSNVKDIAIVGMACNFPKSESITQFWDNLRNGEDLVHTYSDEELKQFGIEEALIKNPNFKRIDAKVDNAEEFDFSFFGYTQGEAQIMDPQSRMMHQVVWEALEDASIDTKTYKNDIGLYVAAANSYNWLNYTRLNPSKDVDTFFTRRLGDSQFINTLISYKLNLTGPSLKIDTACSSSLVAIHLACRNLLLRECTIAIAGGININTIDNKGYFYEEGMIYSKDGRCKPFDKNSSGTIGGEGAGVVVLKRMEDALRDKDHIYAVVRASSVNNDGNTKIGYTAPSIVGQSKCITNTYKFANIEPKSINYIEAHGTGTQLGDPVEVASLNKVFKDAKGHKCALGSVKSNMGHLDTGAGVAGFIKASLALYHEEIPPTLHFNEKNENVDFASGPFYVNNTLQKMVRSNGSPLRAGVSSLGIGGTNAHILLEEAPEITADKKLRKHELITYSAKTSAALHRYKAKLKDFLATIDETQLANVAYTSKTGRTEFNVRDFIVCDTTTNGIKNLEKNIETNTKNSLSGNKNIIFMFPGQGSQFVTMGKTLYQEEAIFKSVMDTGFAWLQAHLKEDYKAIIGYTDNTSVDVSQINHTIYTQPLLFLIEVALAKLLMSWGIQPSQMIGHSLGEYAAACIAGVFSLEDGLKLITKRATLMQALPKGDMLAVGETAEAIALILPKELSIAAINTSDSCTVSGNPESIAAFEKLLDAQEISFKKLHTSHAFHSEMMDEMLPAFEKELQTIRFSNPTIPFISNRTGKEITATEATTPQYWTEHIRNTVQFNKGLQELTKKYNGIYLEIGPGTTLSYFAKQQKSFRDKTNTAVQTMSHPKKQEEDSFVLANALGTLWSQGISIDWKAYYNNEILYKIPLPTYSFEPYKFPARINLKKLYAQLGMAQNAATSTQNDLFYVQNWKKTFQSKKAAISKDKQTYLLFSNETPCSNAIKESLLASGNVVVEVMKGDTFQKLSDVQFAMNPTNAEEYQQLFKALTNEVEVDTILYTWDSVFTEDSYETVFNAKLNLGKALIAYRSESKRKLVLIGNYQEEVLGNETVQTNALASNTILDIASQENPLLKTITIDVSMETSDASVIANIINDIQDSEAPKQSAYRNRQKWTSFFEAFETSEINNSILGAKTYVITGGLGIVGEALISHLCDTYNATVIVLGRTELPPKSEWLQYSRNKDVNPGIIQKIAHLVAHQKNGRNVHYVTTDIAKEAELLKTIFDIESEYGKVAGVIHAAGISDTNMYKFVEEIDQPTIQAHFSGKVTGTQNMYNVFKDKPLDFAWITSSLSSVLGGLTYGTYASANKYIDAFMQSKMNKLQNWSWVNLDGVSDKGLQATDIVRIFETSIHTKEVHQLIISSTDINARNNKQQQAANKETAAANELIIERPEIETSYQEPTTKTEKELCALWEEFFGYEKVGLQDDFFDLGGDSLKAMTVIKRMNKTFNISYNLKDFFSKSTVKELAEEIDLALQVQSLQISKKGKTTIKI
ncbi:acyl transferase domain-containing protein [Kordia periserrulae]|uniref:Acyl transferase domain-containing protein n=1 Tax=Kordia periserrulae TaxID=701523 RepID=A0A2T6BZ77_9FLAO|nr:type I polyketide synthase [Kordia periserrulae]PTX61371.1 acyl transferase domain-containing protein [Kordia periserrulae]